MTPVCPRCTTTSMHRSHAHGVWVLACSTCHGLWLDRDACSSLSLALTREHAHAEAHVFDAPCPMCRQAMERITVREIALERCEAHGVWFDHQELDHIVHAHAQTAASPRPTASRRGGMDTTDVVIASAEVGVEVVSNADVLGDVVGAVFDFFS